MLWSLSYSEENAARIPVFIKKAAAKNLRFTIRKIEHVIAFLTAASSLLLDYIPIYADHNRPMLCKKLRTQYLHTLNVLSDLIEQHRMLTRIPEHEGTTRETAACLLSFRLQKRYTIKYSMPGYLKYIKHMKETCSGGDYKDAILALTNDGPDIIVKGAIWRTFNKYIKAAEAYADCCCK